MTSLTIISQNVHGLTNSARQINRLAYTYQANFVCIQEHWISDDNGLERIKHRLNHTKIECSLKTRVDMGCMIISYGGGWDIISTIKGDRFIICKISNGEEKLNLVNIHAPSHYAHCRPKFFKNLTRVLAFEEDRSIIVGDFNVVLENIDKTGLQGSQGKDELIELIDVLGLHDAWRFLNQSTIDFTCQTKSRNDEMVKARYDRAYIPTDTEVKVARHVHHATRWTDHSSLVISLYNTKRSRGSPHWKLNVSFLEESEYVNFVESLIDVAKIGLTVRNVKTKWETLVENIRDYSKDFGRERAEKQRRSFEFLQAIIDLKGEDADEETRARYDQMIDAKLQGYRIRARIKDPETEDTSYFISAERKHIVAKTIKTIRTREGHLTCHKEEIVRTFHEFYTDLYTESGTLDFDMQAHYLRHVNALSDADRESIDMNIGLRELRDACFAMELGKSPGPNGLPVKFFRTFFDSLAPLLALLVDAILEEESIPHKMQLAYMTLLLKDENNPEDPKNYRPISLLNVEYKLLTRCLANKLSRKISSLVNTDQTCSVPKRSIINHNHFIRDLIAHVENTNETAAILSLDQAKAFDRVSHSWLCKVLRAFNLPELFVKWVEVLYDNAHSQILVNNELSSVLELGRGVRQGCPLSPMLYILTLEPLLNAIRSNNRIIGIQTPACARPQKVLAYADDTNFFSSSPRSVDIIIEAFKKYGSASGSLVNIEKSKAMLIGRQTSEFNCLQPITWVTKIKMFGIWYSRKGGTTDNWDGLLNEIENTLGHLYIRNMSMFARANIVNTRIIPKFLYRLHTLDIEKSRLKKFVSIMREFMNKGNGITFIKYDTLTQPRDSGGAALRNLEVAIIAQRLKVLRLMMVNVWPSPLSEFYLGARLLRLGIKPDNGIPHYEGENLPTFYKNLIQLTRTDFPRRRGYGPKPIKLLELVLNQPASTYYKTLNAQIHEQDNILLYQMPGAPVNIAGYNPKQSFIDLHRARLRNRDKGTIYRLFFSALPTRQNMKIRDRHGRWAYQTCCICGQDRETVKHLFLDCIHLRETLLWINQNLRLFRPGEMRFAIFALFVADSDNNEVYLLRIESIVIFVNMIWKLRTIILSKGNADHYYNGQTILAMYRSALRKHLNEMYPDGIMNFDCV